MTLRRLLIAAATAALASLASSAERGASTVNLIDLDQKAAAEKSLRELQGAKTAKEAATINKAVVTLVRNQHSLASVRGFTVVQDEPASVAGGATGPTPTDFLMVSLGTCQNVVFVRFAALAGVSIASLETAVSGTWDRRGLYGIADIDPGFQEITIETNVATDASNEQVAEIARRTLRGCPIYRTLRKETELRLRLFVNGHQVPL